MIDRRDLLALATLPLASIFGFWHGYRDLERDLELYVEVIDHLDELAALRADLVKLDLLTDEVARMFDETALVLLELL